MLRSACYLLLSFALISCSGSTGSDSNGDDTVSYAVQNAFPNLTFDRPLDLQHAGDGTGRLFVVEQEGRIHMFQNDTDVTEKTLYLDITDRVTDIGNEEGLLGLAFHPDFENNGFFYVNYTADNPDRTVISRFEAPTGGQTQVDASSESIILSFLQAAPNHNGGQLAFGPDGYLYIASGDGGGAGDPQQNGQDRTNLLGTILRIDINNAENGNNYAIPPDNPFVGNNEGYREEIYAYGLRNPWRFSFDIPSGSLIAADVGQNAFEEVNLIESGGNYGWNIMEGTECFQAETCDRSGLILPIETYAHTQGNMSITGGFVYRGPTLDGLTGRYIYADFISGRIWALDFIGLENPLNEELIDTGLPISSFGTDGNNELYICSFDGNIYRIAEEQI